MNEFYQFNHPATGCTKCPALLPGRHHVVWSRGPKQAAVMLIGEAPGYNEDIEGLPFIGRSGRSGDKLLLTAGIPPKLIHIANRIMCHPPGDRDPEPEEIQNCLPWLVEHLRMVQPKALILFGRFAIELMFDKSTVKDTFGLMHTSLCFGCGGRAGEHLPRWAENGAWLQERRGPREYECAERSAPLVVAAIYHPAYVGRDAPELEPAVVHQLTRLRHELELQGITFEEEEPVAGA